MPWLHLVPRLALSCAALALTGTALADGGGGSRSDSGTDLAAAQRLIDAKNWNGAITELERARRKDNRNAEVHNLLGYSLRHAGRLPEAFSEYETALRLDPSHRGAHEYVGEAWLQSKRPDKAREHLDALNKLCGTDCEQYRDLAKAIAAYESAATTTSR